MEPILGMVMALWIATFLSLRIMFSFHPDLFGPYKEDQLIGPAGLALRVMVISLVLQALWIELLPYSHERYVLVFMFISALLGGGYMAALFDRVGYTDKKPKRQRKPFDPSATLYEEKAKRPSRLETDPDLYQQYEANQHLQEQTR